MWIGLKFIFYYKIFSNIWSVIYKGWAVSDTPGGIIKIDFYSTFRNSDLSRSWLGFKNLPLWLAPRWWWCCFFRIHALRTTDYSELNFSAFSCIHYFWQFFATSKCLANIRYTCSCSYDWAIAWWTQNKLKI